MHAPTTEASQSHLDFLIVSDDGRAGVRTETRSGKVSDPIMHRFVDSVFQRS